MPLAHDQFDNAARVRRLGVGDAIPQRRFTGKQLASLLASLLDSSPVVTACRQTAELLAPRDGIRRAADAILRRISMP
jgi:rhamnosyltransferase subunit B